ncbi:DUF5689 domain-containing protein [Mesonia maritima]|uniref:DUF5689 domain-containing protein n=1 Tax=Mesonia maritima TaxID=1793873 RepID=A0ABU1K383_9FLAO|nr:DUF5689 domain-containing protein [Mesonia maritima]MDR6300063.1 hypothetical protein [Mesonia maritima]
MKISKNFRFLSFLFILGIAFTSCVQDDDFQTPEITYEEPDVNVNTTIGEVKELYSGGSPALITSNANGDPSDPMWLEGYVVSNDEKGNFYKTLVIQDKPENPEHGISISTEAQNIFSTITPGRKVYVRVNGLSVGEYAGLPTIGTLEGGTNIGRMSVQDFDDRVKRSLTKEDIIPNKIEIDSLSRKNLNTLIELDSVQFSKADIGEVYGQLNSTQSVNRTIENCEGDEIILRNSGFASFSQIPIPDQRGNLIAVYSTFNTDAQLFIRSTEDVNFTSPRCGSELAGSIQIPFTETFEDQSDGSTLNVEGWTNFSESGSVKWNAFEDTENNPSMGIGAIASAFESDSEENVMWLITPGMDFDAQDDEVLTFKTSNSYADGSELKVLISTDWDGNPDNITAATWENLSSANIVNNGEDFKKVINSGEISLSSYSGTGYVAFKYTGGKADEINGTYELDDVSVSVGGGGSEENIIFQDSFDTNFSKWSTYDVDGNQEWEISDQFGNPAPSAVMSGYDNNANNLNEDWLISEAIDLSGVSSAFFSFDNVRKFSGNPIEVYYSTDYNGGDPNSDGTWLQLSPNLDTDTSSFGNWVDSGDLDVSAAAGGNLFVAFKYTSTTSASTTIEIDNVIVKGN